MDIQTALASCSNIYDQGKQIENWALANSLD